MISLTLLTHNFLLLTALMTTLWCVSLYCNKVCIVDAWWSMGFLLVTSHTVLQSSWSTPKAIMLACVAVWAIRLWLHLLMRNWGSPEDKRYAAFRRRYGAQRYRWFSFLQVFMLQASLIFLISAPLQVAGAAPASESLGFWHGCGLILFLIGFLCESIADWQLRRFKQQYATQQDAVLNTGLWRYSRHPNYFGDAVVWWGFGCMALHSPYGIYTLIGPAIMTYLLRRVSGVPMLEQDLQQRKPAYRTYMQETPAFWPARPRANRSP